MGARTTGQPDEVHYGPSYLRRAYYCLNVRSRLSLELGPFQAKSMYTMVTRMLGFHSKSLSVSSFRSSPCVARGCRAGASKANAGSGFCIARAFPSAEGAEMVRCGCVSSASSVVGSVAPSGAATRNTRDEGCAVPEEDVVLDTTRSRSGLKDSPEFDVAKQGLPSNRVAPDSNRPPA
jgi:hypothetical protein